MIMFDYNLASDVNYFKNNYEQFCLNKKKGGRAIKPLYFEKVYHLKIFRILELCENL